MKLEILMETIMKGKTEQMRLQIEISHEGLMIGRKAEGFRIRDAKISANHVLLFKTIEGRLALIDLGSRNGTKLNNNLIERSELQVGDKIQLGSTRITILNLIFDNLNLRDLSEGSEMPDHRLPLRLKA